MRVHTIVIGAGQAGLAASASLTALGIDHVVLERGRVANAWRTERWDSFRLLTPNWMTRLPHHRYDGRDPNGYMDAGEIVSFFDTYAARIDAPVEQETAVRSVARRSDRFEVTTDRGRWISDAVVIATGSNSEPRVPAFASRLSSEVLQITPATYKRPEQLPAGNVLVVGASSSGVQLAAELQASGRDVTLAVGRHARMPRGYRGADIITWMEGAGILRERAADVRDLDAARRNPSLQLAGSAMPQDLDLNVLQARGVRLAGRLVDVDRTRLTFAEDLHERIAEAERKLDTLLRRIDDVADAEDAPKARRPEPVQVPVTPNASDVRVDRIETVVWATGFTRSYPWLHVPVVGARTGDIRQRDGVTPVPGLYTVGMRFQRTRRSNWIDGVGDDAGFVAEHIAARAVARAAA
jgi:putative flavoprotein involved in K+ transport